MKKVFTILFIFQSLFTQNYRVAAQETAASSSQEYTGLWSGGCYHLVNGENKSSSMLWKIHKVDNTKKQIELTELMYNFDDTTEIENPLRKIYKGFTNDNGLQIELKIKRRKYSDCKTQCWFNGWIGNLEKQESKRYIYFLSR